MLALYVDNDKEDFDIVKNVVDVVNPLVKLINVENGLEALKFLAKTTVLPDLIILDINMPIMDGRICLKKIKSQFRLKDIPVIMYSTGENVKDIELCYRLGALSYVQKPFTFKEAVDNLSKFFKK